VCHVRHRSDCTQDGAGRLALSVGPALTEALIVSQTLQQLSPQLHADLQSAAADEAGTRSGTRAFARSFSVTGVTVSELDSDGRRTRSQVCLSLLFMTESASRYHKSRR